MHLPHGLGLYWRDPETVQLGFGSKSHVLPRIYPREVEMLALLSRPVTLIDIETWAERHGVDASRARLLFEEVSTSLGIPSPSPAYPDQSAHERAGLTSTDHRAAHVCLTSTGLPGILLARALTSAGLGRITFTDSAPIGLEEARWLGSRWMGMGVDVGVRSELTPRIDAGPVDLHVDISSRALPHETGARLLAEDTPFLPVVLGEFESTIGPLIVSGTSPCLECIRLHNTDEDPAWPVVDMQARRLPALAIDTTSAMMIAAWTVNEVLCALTGPSRLTRHRIVIAPGAWPRLEAVNTHPECGCSAAAIDHRQDR